MLRSSIQKHACRLKNTPLISKKSIKENSSHALFAIMTTGTPFPCVPPRNDNCYGVDVVSGVSDAFTTTSPGKFRVVKNYQHLLAAAYSDFCL